MSPAVAVKETMEDRIKEFRSDPQKMDVTTKFVNEVVEKAKDEALKRMKEKDKGKQKEGEREKVQDANLDGRNRKRGRWHSRARGFFSRLFSSLCFCSTETGV